MSRPKIDPNWLERILGRYEMTEQETPEPEAPTEEPEEEAPTEEPEEEPAAE